MKRLIKRLVERVSFLSLALVIGGAAFSQSNLTNSGLDQNIGGRPQTEYKSADEALSDEEFRRGVQAFYRGSFNEAILQFEKALSYQPEKPLILEWMGRAYYYSGLEATAVDTWERLSQTGYGGILLNNRISIVKERRVGLGVDPKKDKFTEAGSYYGVFNGNSIFFGPASILPNLDGTSWVTAYASNELLKFDVNGYVVERYRGPLNGFDHPLDLIKLKSGDLLIAETAGDRLALMDNKGHFKRYISGHGIKKGEVIAPLYLAQDSHENIFVTDYGNKRVDVFNKDGEPLFFFGGVEKFKTVGLGDFPGLKGPTGIAIISDNVFVADDWTGAIHQFDASGNYISTLIDPGTFKKPESLKAWEHNGKSILTLCASNKVYSIDPNSGSYFENATTGNAPSRTMAAVRDTNGNLLVTDYKSNEVYVMAKMQDLIGGLFVQTEKIDASKFPEVTAVIKVENRERKPIVGLKEQNFYLTESKVPVLDCKFLGSMNENDWADITLLIDRSEQARDFSTNGSLENAVRTIASKMNPNGILRIVSAAETPIIEYQGNPSGAILFNPAALKAPISKNIALDLSFRLAAGDLIAATGKRAIVVLGAATATQGSFDRYSLSQTVTYLNNNSISCFCVNDKQVADESYRYIIENTAGGFYYLWRQEGLGGLMDDILSIPSGLYAFRYTSQSPNDFGEKFIKTEVETYLLNRSGRDEAGYYSPLE